MNPSMLSYALRSNALRFAGLLALFTALVGGASSAGAQTDEGVASVQRLMQSGQSAQALAKVDQLLADSPRQPRLRFLRGVMLADANRPSEAIDVYRQLSLDYPELPEPYNNRAVIHAAQGEYEQAREQLEAALRAQPDYAVARQNLGDVYLELARIEYGKAMVLEPNDPTLKPKLAMLRTLTQAKAEGAAAAAAASAARIAR